MAERLLDLIPDTEGAPPISGKSLQAATGASDHQVRSGVRLLRDLNTDGKWPLVSCHQGYYFTLRENEVQNFQSRNALVSMALLRRGLTGAIVPWLVKTGATDYQIQLARRQVNRLLEDLRDLVRT